MTSIEKTNERTAAIREVLVQVWDPIGCADAIRIRDAYDAYVADIDRLLGTAKADQAIVNYLLWVEKERMGLAEPSPEARLESVVTALRAIG